MAKQLNIDVNLNTAKASAQLKALQAQLSEAITSASSKGALTREIVQATEAATKLKAILNASMNSQGNLDLSKFSQNLTKSKTNLTSYAKQLNNLGTAGQQAFTSMAKQIVTAQAPIREVGTLSSKLFTTLKNTARWQLSSAVLHQIVGSFQSAMSYAHGLDESLNSIRIVTGLSADEMNRFAKSANESAKALSASTLDYTDAALIYYQQGIRDQEQIKERTDATIKMANVTGDSAAKVSNQLTAIWNNFDKGGQNLEYYADVITALGAATASSSSEISAGLEKFASIAEETGLSYEYATSSLATIVATTRQSADVVGTALKTIFGRVQSLNLGETLDDGTTLGKYSQALEKVGINIKDQNGQLKDMDVIIDEMGHKWKDLDRDQRVALAQSVAGARQYNQLMALMENYDFFKENVAIAKGSTGELQKQADIYAESWEAARTRVKAASQGIIDDLIDDTFFVKLNDGFAGLLSGVDKFIDSIGGLPGVLGLIGTLSTKIFANQLTHGIERAIQSVKVFTGIAGKEAASVREQTVVAMNSITPPKDSPKSAILEANYMKTGIHLANEYQLKLEQIAKAGGTVSNIDREHIAMLQEIANLYSQIAVEAQKEVEASEASLLNLQQRIVGEAETNNLKKSRGLTSGEAVIAAQNAGNQAIKTTDAFLIQHGQALGGVEGLKTALKGYSISDYQQKGIDFLLRRNVSAAQQRLAEVQTSGTQIGSQIKIRATKDGSILSTDEINKYLMTAEGRKALSGMYFEGLKKAGYSTTAAGKQSAVFDMAKQREENLKVAEKELEAAKTMRSYGKDIKFHGEAIKQRDEALKKQSSGKELSSTEQAWIKRGDFAEARLKEMQKAINGTKMAKDFETQLRQNLKGSHFVEDLISGSKNRVKQDANANLQFQNANEQNQILQQNISKLQKESFSGLTKGISNAASGVASLSLGLSSLKSAIDAINDSSMSFGEKFLSVSMSMGMGISMLISGITSLGGAFTAIGASIKGFVGAQLMSTVGFSAEEVAAMSLSDQISYLGLAKLEETGASASATAGEMAHAGAMTFATAAAHRLGAALKSMLVIYGPWIAMIAGVVAVVAAIKKVTAEAQEMTPEGQLEMAQAHVDEMKTSLEQTKTAAENLKSSFDNYNSIADNLKGCIKGTQEWTEALRENNNEVINLLAQYPELAKIDGAIKKDKDGVLSISEEAQEELIKQGEQNVRNAEWAVTQASQEVVERQNQIKQRELVKDWHNQLFKMEKEITEPKKEKLPDFRQERLEMSKEQPKITKDSVGLTQAEDFLKDAYWVSDDIKQAVANSQVGQVWQEFLKPLPGQLAELATSFFPTMKAAFGQFRDFAEDFSEQSLLPTLIGTENDPDHWGTFTRNLGKWIAQDIPASLEIQNAREDLHNIEASPDLLNTKYYDAFGITDTNQYRESYQERRMGGTAGFLEEGKDIKSKGLDLIADHWSDLMGLSAQELAPALDSIFKDSGMSLIDSSTWAKELTSNKDLRQALNENAASAIAAQTAQAAQEASTINEELIAQGYSKIDAETISNILGQQGKLSELTEQETRNKNNELRKKDTNALALAREYIESIGGGTFQEWTKEGISYKDASGADQTATWDMMSSALGAAAALEQLGASAADAASFLATLNSGEMPEDTAKGIQEYLEHGNFLDMTPEELAKQTTQSAKDIAQSIRDTGMDEDAFKEMTGKDIDQFAEEMVNSAKGNAEAWDTFVSNLTESQKQEIEGLNNYSKMSAADIMDYYDNHFKPKDIDLSNERRSYEDLKENVDGIRESWDAVGDSIKDGAHVTTELQGLFDELDANTGDLGQYIEGDLITDAEGLKAYLDSLNDSLVQDIEHAKQLDMIGYNNIIAEMGSLNLETEEGRTRFEQLKEAAESFKDSISNLSLLQAQLSGVTEGFGKFQKAIEADKASDYTDDLASSISTFMEVSGKGQINSDTYKTGLELLVPEDYQTDRSTAEGYIRDVLGQYFTRDSSGNISVESGDIDNFLAQALKNGALTGTADNFSLAEGIDSVETFADKMNLTKEAAFALMEALSKTSEHGSEMFTTMMQNSDDATYKMMGVNQELQTLYEKKEQAIKDGNWTLVAEIDGNIEEKLGELETFKKEAEDTVTTYWEVKQKKEKALDKVEQLKEELAGVQDVQGNGLDDKDVNPKTGRTKVQIEADLTKAQEQVTDFANKLDGMEPSEIGVRLKLESMEEQKSQIKSKISEIEQEIANSTTKIDENGKEIEVTAHYGTVEEAANEVQHLNDTLNSVTTQQKSIAVEFHAEGVLDEITNISDELGDVPPNTQAKVSAPGAKQAAGDVRSLNTELGRVRSTSATVTVTVHEDHIKTTTEYVNQIKGKYPGGGTFYSGSSFAKGSAFATGHLQTVGAAGQGALVGELGTELVVDPHSGMYYTVGDNGAEIVNMPKDAIIFNHKQTENLLKYKRINSRGQAYAYGSAFGMKHESAHDPWASSSSSSSGSSSGSSGGSSSSSSSGSGGKKKKGGAAAASNGEILTYEEQLLNIIRDEVDEYANLERSITRLEHAYKNFTRNNDRLWGKALLENIQKSIDQGKKLYEAEYAKLEKRKDDYAKSTARLNSTNELQYQQKVLVGGTYAKDPKYNTQLITFQDFKGMDFLTGLGLLDESALQRGANGEVTGVNDVVAVDRAIEEYLRQKGIEANTLRTSKPGEEGEVAAENLMNNANAIAELLNKLLKEYTDSEADMLEQEEKTQDILEEIHDLAAQRIIQEMEMRVQLQDNEKKLIDFAVKRIGDNPFRQAEKFIKQFKPSLFEDVPLRENGVIGTLIKKMDASIDAWNKANNQLALGQKDPHDKDAISLANWQDISQKSFDEIMNDLNELVDFINDMAEAFSKTAELGMAEIEKYTGRMEHTVSVLDHMGKLLDLTGRKYDYASRKTIIEGSMHNLENAWKEAEHWADLMTQQREASEQTYQELLTTDAEGAEWYKQNVLDKSYELEQDALEKMYTAAEDYMTKVEELWDVGLEEIMANWEEAATNGNGFDFLSDSMSKAKSIQEEYLTTTNKLYETNTLMRKVQQNIDKTDSKISKEKLASFNQEIKAAQEKNQLSVVEMEILKARYDLLEAQLALEEARDAKSIVRLQRDSEGNYGYVYTADQDDINEKEQEVADKENDLYNLVLGYYNENQEKRIQVMQEYNAAAEQLYRDWHDRHLMSEDEYKAKLAELYDKANKKLLAIDENLAHSEKWLNITAATDVSEAWSHSFDDRIASTNRYMESFTKANEDTEKLMNKIDGIRDTVTKNAKLGLDDVTKKTDELTKKNDELAKQAEITSNKVADEMRAVDNLTASLAAQYTELQSLITAYYQYAQAMQAAMKEKGPEEAKSPGGDEDLSHSYFIARGEGDMDTANQKASARVIKYTTTGIQRYDADKDGGYLTENEGMIAVGNIAFDKLSLTGEQASDVYHKVSLEAARRGENFSEYSSTQQRAEVTHAAHELGYTQQDAHFKRWDGYGFASGGYTGEWGSEGKLAILHEKELVLNKDDTSNFLHALTIAKSNYEQMIQLQDLQSQYRSALFDSISNNIAAMFNKPSDTLQQEVTIHAEFPNATDHSEIEEAFSNLVNRAAQYASQSGWARDYENIVR